MILCAPFYKREPGGHSGIHDVGCHPQGAQTTGCVSPAQCAHSSPDSCCCGTPPLPTDQSAVIYPTVAPSQGTQHFIHLLALPSSPFPLSLRAAASPTKAEAPGTEIREASPADPGRHLLPSPHGIPPVSSPKQHPDHPPRLRILLVELPFSRSSFEPRIRVQNDGHRSPQARLACCCPRQA